MHEIYLQVIVPVYQRQDGIIDWVLVEDQKGGEVGRCKNAIRIQHHRRRTIQCGKEVFRSDTMLDDVAW